ncbi:hypothetical protein [Nocardia amikacinitolerans]|uniref:hypothetical protein n=1 Tax=Nocardia amikacinitolerans TaxID=756689 RepID=UPI001FE8FF65|nr:hypothetical protein [Nocardia amikacinitolerans]
MTPNLGQGANQALEDAVTLAVMLGRHPIQTALTGYDRLRRTRTRTVARQSHRIGTVAQWSAPAATWLRDNVIRIAPNGMMSRSLDGAHRNENSWAIAPSATHCRAGCWRGSSRTCGQPLRGPPLGCANACAEGGGAARRYGVSLLADDGGSGGRVSRARGDLRARDRHGYGGDRGEDRGAGVSRDRRGDGVVGTAAQAGSGDHRRRRGAPCVRPYRVVDGGSRAGAPVPERGRHRSCADPPGSGVRDRHRAVHSDDLAVGPAAEGHRGDARAPAGIGDHRRLTGTADAETRCGRALSTRR